MTSTRSGRPLGGLGLFGSAGAAAPFYRAYLLTSMASLYKARSMCAGVFLSRRRPESLLAEDLDSSQHPVLRLIQTRVDHAAREVTAGLLGRFGRTVRYDESWGCVPVTRRRRGGATPRQEPLAAAVRDASGDGWDASAASTGIDERRLREALDWAFAEPDPRRPRRTRAVVVVHQGRLVGERYAPGFSADTPLLGWSLTKSVINALIGILVRDGRIAPEDPAPVPVWQRPGDPRRRITVSHLLRMSSALSFSEDYENPLADVGYMLFAAADMAAYAADKPLEGEPGSRWSYSSGTSNILAALIRQIVGDTDYARFPRRVLFERLGMSSAMIERDAAGTFVGSSYMHATARDWARFGLLYANDGLWRGQRILPEGWVRFSRTVAPAAPEADYGAHFWLSVPATYRRAKVPPPPPDTFHAVGHEGQLISIVPSRELVVVRLGLTRAPAVWDHAAFLHRVLGALPAEGCATAP